MRNAHHTLALALLISITINASLAAAPTGDRERKKHEKAEARATKIIESDPKEADAFVARAMAREALGKYVAAAKDMTRAIELTPNKAALHNARGSMRFEAGDIKGSLSDYNRAIELAPDLKQRHWQRGIVFYYAGQFALGANQFAQYQTFDDNDVENVVWRFACMVRDVGVDKARKEMLKVRHDRRIPMMKIYAMFRGEAKPEDVIKAAETDGATPERLNYQRFYANYYVGLYLESIGKPELARRNLLAAPKFKNDHYMWHVARVHAQRLAKPKTAKP